MKIRLLGAELFHADRHDKVNGSFSQFCETRLNKEVSNLQNLEAGDLANKKCVIRHKTISKRILDRNNYNI
jgi:hypothetical protein